MRTTGFQFTFSLPLFPFPQLYSRARNWDQILFLFAKTLKLNSAQPTSITGQIWTWRTSTWPRKKNITITLMLDMKEMQRRKTFWSFFWLLWRMCDSETWHFASQQCSTYQKRPSLMTFYNFDPSIKSRVCTLLHIVCNFDHSAKFLLAGVTPPESFLGSGELLKIGWT